MLTRRTFCLTTAATLALPRAGHAATDMTRARATAQDLDQLWSLTVVENGETLLAERFRGPALTAATNVKSVSKTVVSAITGAALDRGVIDSVEATIGDLAPRLIPEDAEPGVADITIEDLLTLRAGLQRTSGSNYGDWVSSPNWVADALGRPMVAAPGTRMLYSTGSTHVLGAVLAQASGTSLLTMARDWIGQPLGIDIAPWTRDPQGYYLGGNEMAISPQGLARFGEMIRQNGTWQGTKVLSPDWIAASLTPRTRSVFSGLGYGYGWFLGRAAGADYALARGYGGQIVAVVPDRAMTIVITSDPTRPARSGGYFGDLLGLIEQDILGAPQQA